MKSFWSRFGLFWLGSTLFWLVGILLLFYSFFWFLCGVWRNFVHIFTMLAIFRIIPMILTFLILLSATANKCLLNRTGRLLIIRKKVIINLQGFIMRLFILDPRILDLVLGIVLQKFHELFAHFLALYDLLDQSIVVVL